MFMNDVLGSNINMNKNHYIALLKTSREQLLNDEFCKSLQGGIDIENINYFFKTAEAIFIAFFWSCQSEDW